MKPQLFYQPNCPQCKEIMYCMRSLGIANDFVVKNAKAMRPTDRPKGLRMVPSIFFPDANSLFHGKTQILEMLKSRGFKIADNDITKKTSSTNLPTNSFANRDVNNKNNGLQTSNIPTMTTGFKQRKRDENNGLGIDVFCTDDGCTVESWDPSSCGSTFDADFYSLDDSCPEGVCTSFSIIPDSSDNEKTTIPNDPVRPILTSNHDFRSSTNSGLNTPHNLQQNMNGMTMKNPGSNFQGNHNSNQFSLPPNLQPIETKNDQNIRSLEGIFQQ